MALPLIRDYLEKNSDVSEADAIVLLKKCMEILFYRDARSYPKYQYAILSKDGIKLEGPISVDQNWSLANIAN